MSKKVLIVDDDPATVDLVEQWLTRQGHQVSKAFDGLDALVFIRREKPDLVVLDIMMPEINGYDVCYYLRFNKDFDNLPILLMTARQEELDADIRQRTNIDFIAKPLDPSIFLDKVACLLHE